MSNTASEYTEHQYQSDVHNRMVILSCIGDTITRDEAMELLRPIDQRIADYSKG